MNTMYRRFAVASLVVSLMTAAGLFVHAQEHSKLDAEKIGKAADTKATTAPDGIVRIAWPRKVVALKVDGMPLKPFAGLGSWAAFSTAPHGAMVMGDTVVFQDEVTPAMDAAFANGLDSVKVSSSDTSSANTRCSR